MGLNNDFLDTTPKAQATKDVDDAKAGGVCTVKGTASKMKRQSIEWEEILANL